MPTKKQIIKLLGQEMWDRMKKTGWLDGITVTIVRAICKVKCRNCGNLVEMCVDPYTSTPIYWCAHCETGGIGTVEKFVRVDGDIPASDIDRAYRAAHGEKIHEWEWD